MSHVPVGSVYPNTQWELTFRDFVRLVRDRNSRARVEPLVDAWFGYRIYESDKGVQIVDAGNQPLDLLAVHLAIQDDSPKQRSLYQTAMSQWR